MIATVFPAAAASASASAASASAADIRGEEVGYLLPREQAWLWRRQAPADADTALVTDTGDADTADADMWA